MNCFRSLLQKGILWQAAKAFVSKQEFCLRNALFWKNDSDRIKEIKNSGTLGYIR